ncbi:calcium-binding protein [Methylophaga sp.]|uniref:calcium-binding protein n=1 Tax=Methylophaga sp. TaxID=2024840 RepID=UPI003A937F69
MATKIFNSTEVSYTGTGSDDVVVGNDLDNYIEGVGGDDFIYAGNGNDIVLGGTGDDILLGGQGDDVLLGEDGDDLILGGSGIDTIDGGEGDDIILGGSGNDTIFGGNGDDIIHAGEGFDYVEGGDSTAGNETVDGNVYLATSDDLLLGGAGNDTFVLSDADDYMDEDEEEEDEEEVVEDDEELEDDDDEEAPSVSIAGSTSALDNDGNAARYTDVTEAEEDNEEAGFIVYDNVTGQFVALDSLEIAEQTETDVRLNLVTRPGSSEINTAATTIAGYNAADTMEFTESGDFSESIGFSGIERIELSDGVNITLSSEQLEENGESLSLGELNPGTHIFGTAGGESESVTINFEYEEEEFEPEDDIVGAEEVEYDYAGFSADEYSVANMFHDVDIIYDASEGEEGSFTRVDGGNETAGASETVYGSEGVDYGTMHSGDDTYYGGDGNDVLAGQSGADSLYGEEGDDTFLIGGFGSGNSGTTSAADDGNQEWIATGAKHDLIVGGDGVDTLRITSGVGADTKTNGTVVLNDANFQGMEVVQVGGTVDQLNVENDALQMLNDHYYFAANGTVDDLSNSLGNNGGTIDNVVVDASGVTANGLRFEGNGNDNTFIGTTQDDVFVGNGGNDTLTGGNGADTFVFGQVHEQVVTGDDDEVQTYVDTAFDLTGIDTITDFVSGLDTIALNVDQFTSLTAGSFTADNLVCSVGAAAGDANDFLLFDTSTGALSYDADGSGAGAAVQFATLTGVTSLSASDIDVFA